MSNYVRSISRNQQQGFRVKLPKGKKRVNFRKGIRDITVFRRDASIEGMFNPYYANDTNAYRPEMWANEAVANMYESMIYGGTVHTDFNDEVANFGEKVHTRRPGQFEGKRKLNDLDDLEDQDVTAADIEVTLNQRVYVSFLLGDADRSLSFQDLVSIYLNEAMQAQTRVLDQVIGAQAYQFLHNVAGGLGTLTGSNAHDTLLDMREVFNDNKVPMANRWLGLASRSETTMQKADLFKSAERRGDGGAALVNAILGRVAGWDTFLELNTPSVRTVTTATGSTVDGAVLEGATSFDVATGGGSNFATGQWITVAGDNTPLRVTTVATDTLTVARGGITGYGLRYNVATGAAVTNHASGLIDQASPIAAGDKTAAVSDGYPAGWLGKIHVDGTGVPRVGQLVAFKAAGGTLYSTNYCIIQVDDMGGGDYEILLDQPLVNTLANNDIVDYGPAGDYNFAFQRNAVALVNRPLELPPPNTGASAAYGFANNMSLRVTMAWDSKKEALRVTISALFGVAKLDTYRGGVLLG